MKIGITYTGGQEKHLNYVRWLSYETESEAIRFEQGEKPAAAIRHCDGLLLSGGRDIHPQFYKSRNLKYKNAPESFDPERDQYEIEVYQEAAATGIPVLAVCRGFQLINCVLGGTLRQDLGKVRNAVHQAEQANDKIHGLHIVADSLLAGIVGSTRMAVNSAHHQAISRTGNGLKINAYSDDGVAEGFEWEERENKPFLLGLQWHPERMFRFQLQGSPLSARIREYFFAEIKTRKERL